MGCLLRSVSSFAEAVADVSQRTGWMRQYIDDFRLNANRSRDSDDDDIRGRSARFVGSHASATQGCSSVVVIFWWSSPFASSWHSW